MTETAVHSEEISYSVALLIDHKASSGYERIQKTFASGSQTVWASTWSLQAKPGVQEKNKRGMKTNPPNSFGDQPKSLTLVCGHWPLGNPHWPSNVVVSQPFCNRKTEFSRWFSNFKCEIVILLARKWLKIELESTKESASHKFEFGTSWLDQKVLARFLATPVGL